MRELDLYTIRFCPWCDRAKSILDSSGIPYREIPIDEDPFRMRQEIAAKTGGRSDVPQAFLDGTYLGDDDALAAALRSGELQTLVGIPR